MKVTIIRTHQGKQTSESTAEFYPSQLEAYQNFLLMNGIEISGTDAAAELECKELVYKLPIEV